MDCHSTDTQKSPQWLLLCHTAEMASQFSEASQLPFDCQAAQGTTCSPHMIINIQSLPQWGHHIRMWESKWTKGMVEATLIYIIWQIKEHNAWWLVCSYMSSHQQSPSCKLMPPVVCDGCVHCLRLQDTQEQRPGSWNFKPWWPYC